MGKIKENYAYLAKHLTNPSMVLCHLHANGILTRSQMESIQWEKTSEEQNSKLMDFLIRKETDQNFQILIEILRNTCNEHCADRLQPLKTKEMERAVDKAKALFETGRFKEALEKYKDLYEKLAGINEFVALSALHNIGIIYFYSQKYKEALELFWKVAHGLEKKLLGFDRQMVLVPMLWIIDTLRASGNCDKAQQLCKNVIPHIKINVRLLFYFEKRLQKWERFNLVNHD